MSNLLAGSTVTVVIVVAVIAVCVIGLVAAVYGFFRKFSCMGWMAWQILLSFVLLLSVTWLPATMPRGARFWLGTAFLLIGLGVVFGGATVGRHFLLKRYEPLPKVLRILDRVLGAVTAVLDVVMVFGITAGVVCVSMDSFFFEGSSIARPEFLAVFENNAGWDLLSAFVFDLFVVAIFSLCVNAGFRVGFGRMALIFVMFALTAGAFALSALMTIKLGMFRSMASGIGGAIKGVDPSIGGIIGSLITMFILFIVLFVGVGFAGWGLNKLVAYCRYNTLTGIIDSALLAFLFFVIMLLVACGINALVAFLANDGLNEFVGGIASAIGSALGGQGDAPTESLTNPVLTGVFDTVKNVAKGIESIFCSSPISRWLYESNPFAALT